MASFRTVLHLLLAFPQYSYSFSSFHPKTIQGITQHHQQQQQILQEKRIINHSISPTFGKLNVMLSATMDSSSMNTMDDTQEGFPSDPASTTPQLLSALWDLISQGCRLPKGVS